MSRLAALLREYYERSSYKSIEALAEAARAYTPLSKSYLNLMLLGERQNPAYDKVIAIARALALDEADTNRLLEAAGFLVTPVREREGSADPYMQRLTEAFARLAGTPGVSNETLRVVTETVTQVLEGYRTAHLAATASISPAQITPSGEQPRPAGPALRPLPLAELSPEEGMIDDLLGEILSRGEGHPLGVLFNSLEEAARQDRWEIKRRITEALPRLVQLQPDAALGLAELLRGDYHPDYRADIRRRVVEAVPVLARYRPDPALQLLAYRRQDEIYTAMATVEVLHDLERSGQISAAAATPYFAALRLEDPVHQEAILFLRQLLAEAEQDPAIALATMQANRAHPERVFRICILRVVPRLLKSRSDQSLDLLAYFLRQNEDGLPAEHQNLRRPVSRALPELLELLPEANPVRREKVANILQVLAHDPDIHVRRALGDALERLAALSAEMIVPVLDVLIQDGDPYVRQRAWRALLQLADLYPEQANGYYARLLTREGA
jgi:hypothetical protein